MVTCERDKRSIARERGRVSPVWLALVEPKRLHADLRYQLLHRTAAAVFDAQRFAAPHALMLIHSFSEQDAWLDDYTRRSLHGWVPAARMRTPRVRIGPRAGATLYLRWIRDEQQYARV